MGRCAPLLCFWLLWGCAELNGRAVGSLTESRVRTRGRAALRTALRTRIINGSVVENPSSRYPFYAMPTQSANSDVWLGCGASIISPTYGLSAAHCFGGGREPCRGPQRLALWLGDVQLSGGRTVTPKAGGRSFRVEAELLCHPEFDGKCSHGHDIALLKLAGPLPAWVRPVPLGLPEAPALLALGAGQPVMTVGFGFTESAEDRTVIAGASRDLREADLITLGDAFHGCANMYAGGYGCSDEYSEGPAQNLGQQICAGSQGEPLRDTCSGDSGSPMLDASGKQVGIVSYGGGPGEKISGPGRSCGDPNFPGVYTRVSALAAFVRERVPDLP